MKWKKIIIKTKADYEALVSDMLVEKGFEGIESFPKRMRQKCLSIFLRSSMRATTLQQ